MGAKLRSRRNGCRRAPQLPRTKPQPGWVTRALWKTAHERLRLWTNAETWEKTLDRVIVKDDAVDDVEWISSRSKDERR